MTNIFKKLKERYDWKGYWVSSTIASVGAFFIHLGQFPSVNVEILFLTFLVVWAFILVCMIGISELLK